MTKSFIAISSHRGSFAECTKIINQNTAALALYNTFQVFPAPSAYQILFCQPVVQNRQNGFGV